MLNCAALPPLCLCLCVPRYWFFTAMFFSYGRVAITYFNYSIPHHTFISFALYMIGVVVFVLSLEHGYYRYQFEMFAWVHLTLWLIVVQSTVIVVNMYRGLIWFILPALLIVGNDTWAYVFGFFFGKTPLIALSPKKTWSVHVLRYGLRRCNVRRLLRQC